MPEGNLRAESPQPDVPAAEQVFACYAERLVRLAEQHLSQRIKVREDGEDVVQSVLRSFIRRRARGDFRIDGADELWRLLVTMTLRKARAKARRHTAEMRDVRAETAADTAWLGETAAREPGPAEAAALVDQIDALLQGQPPVFGEVLERRLQGDSVTDIAHELGISRQNVYRLLEVLQNRLEKSAAGEREKDSP